MWIKGFRTSDECYHNVMLRSLLVLLGVLAFLPVSVNAGACNQYDSGSTPPAGYGAAWDVDSSARPLLLTSDCNGSSANLRVGSDETYHYVYKMGYAYQGGWQPFTLSGSFIQNSEDWLLSNGTYTYQSIPSGQTYWVGYVCRWMTSSSKWNCGCRDQACSENFWQLQTIENGTTGGGGGSGGGTGSVGSGDTSQPWGGRGIGIYAIGQTYANNPFRQGVNSSIRFVAEHTGQVDGMRFQKRVNQSGQTGYSGGDGGRFRVDLYTDSNGLPGQKLAESNVVTANLGSNGQGANETGLKMTLTSHPTITAGQVYHWKFEQLDGGNNFISANHIRNFNHDFDLSASPNDGISQAPIFGQNPIDMRDGVVRPGTYPMFTTVYTGGLEIGQAMGTRNKNNRVSIGGSTMVRQKLMPGSDRTIKNVYFTAHRGTTATGANDLTIRLKNSGGTVLASATVAGNRIGYVPNDGCCAADYNQDPNHPQYDMPWIREQLSSSGITLKGGSTYYLEFSAGSSADVRFLPMQDLNVNYDFNEHRQGEVRAEVSTNNGSSWDAPQVDGSRPPWVVWPVLLHVD